MLRIQTHPCPGISPKYHPLSQAGCLKTPQLLATHVNGVLNRSQGKKPAIASSQISFHLTNKITNREDTSNKNFKPFNNYCVPVTSQDGYASKPEEEDHSENFQNIFLRNLNALYRFIRPYACAGVVIAATSNSLLPVEKLSDLTPTFFIGLLKALVPAALMHIYVAAVNQLYDVEIDKVNKPYLPLASGEFSKGTGIGITLGSVLMSLAIAIMLRSPPLILGVIVWFLFGTAYSAQLPFLRWKGNSYLAAISIMFLNGFLQQFPFYVHMQKYVLSRPVVITIPLMFATAVICCFCLAIAFLKDLHDVDGDKEFGIETLSVKLGKERVFWLCVYMLSIAYGGAVIVGASSSFLLSKLITIIGHSILASFLWLRARTVDLSNNASTFSFYMFIWQLYYAEYLLIPFVR